MLIRNIARKVKNKFLFYWTIHTRQWVHDYPLTPGVGKSELHRHCNDLLKITGDTVFGGPFAGMKIPIGCNYLRHYPCAIVGSYEEEIHDVILDVICNPPEMIIDIGSAQGFYTVGFALNTSYSKIIGFELSQESQEEAKRLAKANNIVNRIEQKGICTLQSLSEVCMPRSVVLCDCEGAEMELLDPNFIENLKSCRIICELHDMFVPGITAKLVERFRGTHDIEIRCEKPRQAEGYRVLRKFPRSIRTILCDETRYISNPYHLCSGRFMILNPKELS